MEQVEASQVEEQRQLGAIWRRALAIKNRYPTASSGLLSIFDQAVVSGTSFVTAAIIGRMTSPDELGLYYLVLTIVLVISGTQDQLVTAPYVVYSKRRQGRELAEYAGSAWAHQFGLTALTIFGLFAAIGLCMAFGKDKLIPGLWTLLIAGPLFMLRDSVRRFAFANLRVEYVIPLDVVVAIVQLSGLALLGYFGWLSVPSIFAVMGAACGLACLAWFLLDRPRVHFVRGRYLSDWRRNWGFAKWALRTYLVGNTTPYVMLWMLGGLAGVAATGQLGACTTIVGLTNVLLVGVANILTPQAAKAFVRGGTAALRHVLLRTTVFLAATIGAFCLFVTLTGDWLAVVVFGPAFEGTGPILTTLAIGSLLNAFGTVAGNGLWAIDRPQLNFFADVCSMAATLIAAALLIVPLGALGAALAMFCGVLMGGIVRVVTLIRQLDERPAAAHATADSAYTS